MDFPTKNPSSPSLAAAPFPFPLSMLFLAQFGCSGAFLTHGVFLIRVFLFFALSEEGKSNQYAPHTHEHTKQTEDGATRQAKRKERGRAPQPSIPPSPSLSQRPFVCCHSSACARPLQPDSLCPGVKFVLGGGGGREGDR